MLVSKICGIDLHTACTAGFRRPFAPTDYTRAFTHGHIERKTTQSYKTCVGKSSVYIFEKMMIGSYWFRTFCTLVLFYGTRIVYLSRAKPTAGAKMMHHTNRHDCALVGCLHENTISGRVLVCDKICARKYEKRKSFGCLRGVPWEIAKAKCCNVG